MLDPLDSIAGELKDALSDPSCWTKALDSINHFVDGSGAVLLSVDERLRHAPSSVDIEEMMRDYFADGWHAKDLREGCRPLLTQNGLAFDHEFQEADDIEKSSYYADFLRKHGCKWFAGVGANLDGDLWCLALQRSVAKGPFTSTDLPRLRAIQKSLAEAAQISRGMSCSWLQGAFYAFDLSRVAAIVSDREGRILEMSEAARAIIGRYTDRFGCVRLPDAASSKALNSMLRYGPRSDMIQSSSIEQYSLRVGNQTYTMRATRILKDPNHIFSKASNLLQFHVKKPTSKDTLKNKYGLTVAECSVAMALASGLKVEHIAVALHIKTNTVRSHLKSAYAKTRTGTQAKLAVLISNLSID